MVPGNSSAISPKSENLSYQAILISWLKSFFLKKELSLCHKLWFSNPYIFGTQCRKSLIFHTYIIWTDRSRSLKCQRSTTLGSKDTGIRKSKFVAKTQLLCHASSHISSSKQAIDKKKIFFNSLIRLELTVPITSNCYFNTGDVVRAHKICYTILKQVLKHKSGLCNKLSAREYII